jgi:hypothetical protein
MANLNKKIEDESKVLNIFERTESTKMQFEAEPKVKFIIPLEGMPKGSFYETCINGYKMRFPRGVWTEIPESIYKEITSDQLGNSPNDHYILKD